MIHLLLNISSNVITQCKKYCNLKNRSDIPNGKAYVFAWNNVWEWGNSGRAHEYANEDYKVRK